MTVTTFQKGRREFLHTPIYEWMLKTWPAQEPPLKDRVFSQIFLRSDLDRDHFNSHCIVDIVDNVTLTLQLQTNNQSFFYSTLSKCIYIFFLRSKKLFTYAIYLFLFFVHSFFFSVLNMRKIIKFECYYLELNVNVLNVDRKSFLTFF